MAERSRDLESISLFQVPRIDRIGNCTQCAKEHRALITLIVAAQKGVSMFSLLAMIARIASIGEALGTLGG
jgi:hypothetical protein